MAIVRDNLQGILGTLPGGQMEKVSRDFKKALLIIGGIKLIDIALGFFSGRLNPSTLIFSVIGVVVLSGFVTTIAYVIRRVFIRKDNAEKINKRGWILLIVGVLFTLLLIFFTGGVLIREDYTVFYFNRQSIPGLPFIARTDKLCITRGTMQNESCYLDLMENFMDRHRLFLVIETPGWIYR